MTLRGMLYKTQRFMGSASAFSRGKLPQRLARRPLRRGIGRFLSKRHL